ncbi:MAG TPA: cysteine desulfurase family protein [Stellaceae bacterium]|jgi:cysteine desulfurase|nr:cysteine desulfurase family protein [Stellaceae bacterium]
MRRETYLDWNATTPLRPEAATAIAGALALGGNPSSVHASGRAARQLVERSRATVAALVGVAPDGIVFTSGGTEANHLALLGSGRGRVLVSAVEHSSVLQALPDAERIPVDRDGLVDGAALAALLAAEERPALVSVMLANNETGVIQPVRALAEIAHSHGALFHCDAVQAVGKILVSLTGLGTDLLTMSAHKLGGPAGAGALVMAPGVEVAPLQRGGGQERYRRAGTENLAGIAGFAAAAAVCDPVEYERVRHLRDRLEAALPSDAIVIGAGTPRLPNTSAIAMPGVPAETQVIALDLDGVMVSAGAACSSGKVGSSHVLAAMGLAPDIANATIRVSLGWSTTEADIAHFLDAWATLYRRVHIHASRNCRAA